MGNSAINETTIEEITANTSTLAKTALDAGPAAPADPPATDESVQLESKSDASGSDARPEENAKAQPIPSVRTVRRTLGLTQEEFAVRYAIPLGTLRDWEQGRTEPDRPARAYLRVIACNPEWVSRALAAGS